MNDLMIYGILASLGLIAFGLLHWFYPRQIFKFYGRGIYYAVKEKDLPQVGKIVAIICFLLALLVFYLTFSS